MATEIAQRAVRDITSRGNALLKFISPNDAGATGSHQAGFYLPKAAWELFSTHPPTKGSNKEDLVRIRWQDERITDSRVIWYGQGTRSEYRLTRFGRGFPFLNEDRVGDLFVLIPDGSARFIGYVLDRDEDIDELLSVVGVDPSDGWGIYADGRASSESPADCEARGVAEFSADLLSFPDGSEFSEAAIRIMDACSPQLKEGSADDRILKGLETEYRLFKAVERRLCHAAVTGPFQDVDTFIRTAASIMNRRKSRAGRSLENHVDSALTRAGIDHDLRADRIQGEPDFVVPHVEAYADETYPRDRVFVLAAKTTCKERWRQVLDEGPLVPRKHLITTQPGISSNQLRQMVRANVQLVVPKSLHPLYPEDCRGDLMTVEELFLLMRKALEQPHGRS
jgi:type II restriction enzyme